jgi:hypothetical protein
MATLEFCLSSYPPTYLSGVPAVRAAGLPITPAQYLHRAKACCAPWYGCARNGWRSRSESKSGASVGVSEQGRRLIKADQIRRLAFEDVLLVMSGLAVKAKKASRLQPQESVIFKGT